MRLTAITTLFIFATSAQAGVFTGNELLPWCESNKAMIYGYAAGSLDRGHAAYSAAERAKLPEDASIEMKMYKISLLIDLSVACMPPGVILDQVSEVFCDFLTENPGRRHESAAILFSSSIMDAWPCHAN